MNVLPTPTRTSVTSQPLVSRDPKIARLEQALLSKVDGHRNVVELESFARAIGLEPEALERMRLQGLIQMSAGL
jgi:hypothetical protein